VIWPADLGTQRALNAIALILAMKHSLVDRGWGWAAAAAGSEAAGPAGAAGPGMAFQEEPEGQGPLEEALAVAVERQHWLQQQRPEQQIPCQQLQRQVHQQGPEWGCCGRADAECRHAWDGE
jgi:hypothetical protein